NPHFPTSTCWIDFSSEMPFPKLGNKKPQSHTRRTSIPKEPPMSFISSLASAFKGGGRSRVPLAHSFVSPWSFALEPAPFEYRGAVRRAFLDNPVAQRAVRLVAEGVGGAPLASSEAEALKLVST